MTRTITRDFRSLVIRADPDWPRDKRFVTEYEFTAPSSPSGDPRTHEGGQRIFKGFYDQRGPYAED